jgi:hypothetical protein
MDVVPSQVSFGNSELPIIIYVQMICLSETMIHSFISACAYQYQEESYDTSVV